jgi:hypothetical protein
MLLKVQLTFEGLVGVGESERDGQTVHRGDQM